MFQDLRFGLRTLLRQWLILTLIGLQAGFSGCQRTQENPLPQPALKRVETVPRAATIVSPQWVKSVLDFQSSGNTARPTNYFNNRAVIVEASWAKPEAAKDYLAGHIPSAIHLNTDDVENGYPRWLLRPVNELHQVVGRLGITPETTVIVYSKQTIAAARIWWTLMYAGVSDVRVLNGGVEDWKAAGFPTETTIRTPQPVSFSAPVREELLATTDYVRTHLNDKIQLADVRSREEFIGQISGYDYVNFKGRIPGAINLGNADDSARLYQNADGTLRNSSEIQRMWAQAGIEKNDREVIFYCGSGWRSSLAFLHAWTMELEHIRNYSDGWAGWSTNYIQDGNVKAGTPGWRQERSTNPIVADSELVNRN
ncbi:MAG: sulfurtransferase [Blastocatellia bacterium]